MVATVYDPSMRVLDARSAYFAANSFGENGGYDDAWVDFALGPISVPIPNTASRIAAVKVHDLHHIVTGYATDAAGEFEISAWEMGAGCGSFVAAWVLNLSGLAAGATFWPKRTFRAFVRGRRSRSLYDRPLDSLLGTTVAELRELVGVDGADADARWSSSDLGWYVASVATGLVVGPMLLLVIAPLMPFGWAALAAARAAARP